MVIIIFQKASKKNRHRNSVGSTSARCSDIDVVKDDDRPEEGPEVQEEEKEKDIEADDEIPYTIETSDVMGRSVTSWEGLWCHGGYCDISGSSVKSYEIQWSVTQSIDILCSVVIYWEVSDHLRKFMIF
jgi:hypothetical protein